MHLRLRLPQPTWKSDIPLVIGGLTGVAAIAHLGPSGDATSLQGLCWTGWLTLCVLVCAFRAMAHADRLAERAGEPMGTIILTVAAITIEIAAVCAVVLKDGGATTIARDSMFAVLMLILNGLIGGCMLVGCWKSGEQAFNPLSASAYLSMIFVLAAITLVLPRFTRSEVGGWMSDSMEVFVGGGSLAIYMGFLWLQGSTYRGMFVSDEPHKHELPDHVGRSSLYGTIAILAVSLIIVVLCAEGVGGRVPALLDAMHLPNALVGVWIAAMVLTPEGFAALRASKRGNMQRSINVLLGSALATIGLTVPALLALRWVFAVDLEFGLEAPYIVLLASTFLISCVSLLSGRVNAIHGFVHVLLFLAWIATILDESTVANVQAVVTTGPR